MKQYREALKGAKIQTFEDIRGDFIFFKQKAIEYDNPHMLSWVNHVLENEYIQGTRHLAGMYLICELHEQYTYDKKYVQILIEFVERSFGATQGGGGIKLAPFQHLLLGVVYGLNRGNQVVPNMTAMLVARGNGKSSTSAILNSLELILNRGIKSDIDILAPSTKQAKISYQFTTASIKTSGSPYKEMLEQGSLVVTRDGIRNNNTLSELVVLAHDNQVLDGRSSIMVSVDEIHALKTNPIPVLTAGSRIKLPTKWRAILITTDGTLRDYTMDEMREKWDSILFGSAPFVDTLPLIFSLDADDDYEDENLWSKASPMLGSIVKMQSIRDLFNSALSSPTEMSEFKAKILNIPQREFEAYFYKDDIEKLYIPDFDITWFEAEDYCAVGIDMALNGDMVSISFIKRDMYFDKYYCKTLNFITRTSLTKMSSSMQSRLNKFNDLEVLEDKVIHHEYVYRKVVEFIKEQHLAPVAFSYDAWKAQFIVERLKDEFLSTGVEIIEVPQNTRHLSPPMQKTKTLITEDMFHSNSDTLAWTMENVRSKIDGNGNVFPNKPKSINKIDTYVSMLIAHTYFTKTTAMQYWRDLT